MVSPVCIHWPYVMLIAPMTVPVVPIVVVVVEVVVLVTGPACAGRAITSVTRPVGYVELINRSTSY